MRKIALFNDNWIFEGSPVTLPHTWNAGDARLAGYRRGSFTYEKRFTRPEGERIFIEFRGAAMTAELKLNGHELGRHEGGYSAFRAELTPYLEEENLLQVTVDNSPSDRIYPQRADFTFYGGIYRDVYLISVPEEHFELSDNGAPAVSVKTETDSASRTARVLVTTRQTGGCVTVTVDGEAKTCASVGGKAEFEFEIKDAHLWDGIGDPYLYTAEAALESGDSVCVRFGLREVRIDNSEGFFLNGRHYPLHGVSRHQDRPEIGNALKPEHHREDIELIRSMGANAVRLAHYQQDQYIYDLCDELGILVWAEIPYISVHMPGGRENTLTQYRALIEQNINHPSIFCWGMSNEISLEGVTEDLMENHRLLNELAHSLDSSRYTSAANLFMLETDSPLVFLPDITGYNLYYGWYVGEKEDNDEWFDTFRREHPDKGLALTEYGADALIKLQSPKPRKGDFTESYQEIYHEHMLNTVSSRPYIWGSFVWNMFDFAAAGRDDAGDPGVNHKGLVTFDRKIKKDAFYVYKARWSEEPFVHLCGRRYCDRIEDNTEIRIYSNLPEVSLYVDGELIETKKGEYLFIFSVPISSGHRIEARAGECSDEMFIRKVSEPNPEYFRNESEVHNWFDEPEELQVEAGDGLSINSTLNDIMANPQAAQLMQSFMGKMAGKVAGGVGANAKIPPMMMKVIGKIPLSRLLQQSGANLSEEELKEIDDALKAIKPEDAEPEQEVKKTGFFKRLFKGLKDNLDS